MESHFPDVNPGDSGSAGLRPEKYVLAVGEFVEHPCTVGCADSAFVVYPSTGLYEPPEVVPQFALPAASCVLSRPSLPSRFPF